MLLAVNTMLYLFAVLIAVAVTSPPSGPGSRRAAVARAVLAIGGGLSVTAAAALGFVGLWFESALAGTGAIVVVGVSMWFALAQEPEPAAAEDEEGEDDDDGGSLLGPPAPEPTRPEGGPTDDLWTDFDAARAAWEREREPIAA